MTAGSVRVAVTALVLAAFASSAVAESKRFALLIGAAKGDPGEPTLRFAEADAERVASILRDVGGFAPEDVIVLKTAKASEVRRTLLALNVRARDTAGDTLLFVFYSGHGDSEALQMAGTRFALTELRDLIYGSPATARVLVIDACRSGTATQLKGGRKAPGFVVDFDQKLWSRGVAILTSSAEGEDSQESDELRASFFTHYLASGLRGAADADSDTRVTLGEAFSHAAERTLLATARTMAGPQHPTFRFDLSGRADLVLTRPVASGQRVGTLVFAEPGRYFVHQKLAAREPVAELEVADKPRTIAVPADEYIVTRRASDYLLQGEIAVPAAGSAVVRGAHMQRIAYARVVRKGGTALSRAFSVYAGGTSRSALSDLGLGAGLGAEAGLRVELPSLSLDARLWGVWLAAPDPGNPKPLQGGREFGALVAGLRSFDLSQVTLSVGIAAGIVRLERIPGLYAKLDMPIPLQEIGMMFGPIGQLERSLFGRTYARLELGAINYMYGSDPRSPYRPSLVWSAGVALGTFL